jgi:hypothetical protein
VELAYERHLSISPPFQLGADRWISSLEDGEEQPDFDEDEDEDEDFEEPVEEGGRGLKRRSQPPSHDDD